MLKSERKKLTLERIDAVLKPSGDLWFESS